ncbi:SusC/RagA family TonB-linked outer membrane protein [Chitinophaga ginsengisegetis]|uniref:SusC/RagA family TonB-linked outer membrane protein n=1 Tax=Chitinophaga ginsengisegetis TaxID=393003 RepID=UPI000DB96E34|nr:SusC/RagA family TonB-linked outer membrane protein [Chitinophaga ginsengisegetis]MDR6570103.1 TonB-linked SusC/RagA family outer membrane protein [Chitinophaga ginsengisegetis]MDR6649837.1 TonB-linked SusC/RagA family outer membrane protein [Chitinophaga ginsengisegetis]MDR6655960.1 TonB-linked SusC/RagA family outer membrane protein [Chitinophaga ginsengisegetis]
MKRNASLCFMLMLFGLLASAQTRTVTGHVLDGSGAGIGFATVQIKGTTTGTMTNPNGDFEIHVKGNVILVVSSVGYISQEIPVTSQNEVTIKLAVSSKSIDEIVVTAGGIASKKKELGYANTVVKSETLVAAKPTNIAGGLQGKVAGLMINGTNGGVNPNYRIVLRGQRSLTGNNQALIVLDNMIVTNDILGYLNPEDVETVTVLNGAGAAALYGSQASNGAVIVTTKKGKQGVTSVNVSQTTTIEQVAFFPKIQKKFGAGGTGYGTDENGNPPFSYLENQSYGPAFDGVKRPLGPALEDGSQDSAYYQYNDGHNKFWNKGLTNQTDFSMSTGDEKSTFYLSGQYLTTKGTTPDDKYNRGTVRVNGTRKIGNTINITYHTDYVQNKYDITNATAAMYANMLNMPSNVDITKYSDWKTNKFANPNGFYNPWYLNPYFSKDNFRSDQKNNYLTGNVELKFTPLDGLDFVARQGIVAKNYNSKNTNGGFTYTEFAKHTDASSKADIAASVVDNSSYKTQYLTDLFVQYARKQGRFDVKLLGGGQWREDQSKYVTNSANGLVVPGLFNVSNGVGTPGATEANYKARQMGVYGSATIGFNNYLFLHITGRNDWVSTLAAANRSFFYPSADLSFVASDALTALQGNKTISFLKLRGGWSKVGQVNLGDSYDFGAYQLEPTISGKSYGFPYGTLAGYTVDNTLVSNNLKPEITKGYEVGFDLNMFDDRFVSNLTWFSTKTDDQTVNTRVSYATGYSVLRTNTGQTQSKGLEVTAHVTPVRSADWSVTVGGNYTWLDNKVNFINSALPRLALSTYGADGPGSYAVPGQTFPVIMGFDYNRTPDGKVIVDGNTGLPSKADTISILGNATPRHRLSLDAQVRYKRFSLSVLFEYRGGYQVYNAMGPEMDWSGTGYRTAIYNRERFVFPNSVVADPANPGKYITNTNITVKNGNGNNGFWTDGINRDVTSNYVTSGDFWKLREISLSYNVPTEILRKTGFVKGLTISVQGRNLFLWMAKDNYYTDPEYSDAGNDSNAIGLTGLGQTPPSRYYGATLSAKF